MPVRLWSSDCQSDFVSFGGAGEEGVGLTVSEPREAQQVIRQLGDQDAARMPRRVRVRCSANASSERKHRNSRAIADRMPWLA
jgi:hypothetical protein